MKKKILILSCFFGVGQNTQTEAQDLKPKYSKISVLQRVSHAHHGIKNFIKKVFGVSSLCANCVIAVFLVTFIIWVIFNIILRGYRKIFKSV